MPTPFNHIAVPSKDLKKAITFYKSLGMELIEHEVNHHAHFENKEHEVIFTAYFNINRPDYDVMVYFEVDDIEVLATRFRESVIPPKTTIPWKGRELHLSDPDGNHVVLYQKLTEQSIPPWQRD